MRPPPQSPARIFAAPAALALASLIGLVIGLTGDGWRDGVAVALLTLPLAALTIAWWRRSQNPPSVQHPKKDLT